MWRTPSKAYFALRFDEIPPQYILGGACFCCGHRGSVSRFAIETRWGANMWLATSMTDAMLRSPSRGKREARRAELELLFYSCSARTPTVAQFGSQLTIQ